MLRSFHSQVVFRAHVVSYVVASDIKYNTKCGAPSLVGPGWSWSVQLWSPCTSAVHLSDWPPVPAGWPSVARRQSARLCLFHCPMGVAGF